MPHAFTLRLEKDLAKKLDAVCKSRGYNKTGLIKSLIQNFIAEEKDEDSNTAIIRRYTNNTDGRGLHNIVGIVSLGGDSVKDTDDCWE